MLSIVCLIISTCCPLYAQDSSSFETGERGGVERATWRFEFDNDFYFNKDNQISSGWSLQKHSAVADSWRSLQGVPGFVKHWGEKIPTLTKEGMVYRAGIAIGQIIQTPDDLSRSDLIENDVPYVGALTMQVAWYAFNDDQFRGFEIVAGMVGSPSLAEQTQRTVHHLFDGESPNGWDNQLNTEPVINFNYMHKHKIWRGGTPTSLSTDAAINGNVGLGNLFTQISVALEMRFGHNMPLGFVYVPDPIGVSMHYMASLKPANQQKGSFYATLVFRGSVFGHNILLDGNTFSDSHYVDKEPLVGMAIAGLHYENKSWGIHFNMMTSSNNVDVDKAPLAEGRERLGSVNVEWRF